jgi:hypothetical protein
MLRSRRAIQDLSIIKIDEADMLGLNVLRVNARIGSLSAVPGDSHYEKILGLYISYRLKAALLSAK